MNRSILRALGAVALLGFAALLLRATRSAPPPPPPPPLVLLPPPAPREERAPAVARPPSPGRAEEPPERLRELLRKLGRARLLKDFRTLAELHRGLPPVFLEDGPWIVARLRDEVFEAAGAADLATVYRLQAAVPVLGERIFLPLPPYLLDLFIDTLAALGGDAAAVVLTSVSRGNADEGIRARAATALGGFQGPEAYHALVAALGDPSSVVRSAAAGALSRMPSPEAAAMIVSAMNRERAPAVLADLAAAAYAASDERGRAGILEAVRLNPVAMEVLLRRQRASGPQRYGSDWPVRFFERGGAAVLPPDARRIGLTIEGGPAPAELAELIFSTAPFDRYRSCFRIRRAEDFPAPRAYDAFGRPLGDVPFEELDGTVFLRFRDPASFAQGVLGYTKGCEAMVTGVSLLHEFGHAFARLGDEYPDGSDFAAVNTWASRPAPWEIMPELGRPLRRDARFWIPSGDCYLSNRPASRYCPVCQLEIHARISELLGTPLPW